MFHYQKENGTYNNSIKIWSEKLG